MWIVLIGIATMLVACGRGDESKTVRIGTKNFTEQLILGELMTQLVENRTELRVGRKFNLGGTMICHGALVEDEIDLYPEYTGTALTAILHREVIADPDSAYRTVAAVYREQFACEWLEPLGFNNTYAITVRRQDAAEKGWEKIGDLESEAVALSAGFTAEFVERPDGYPGLEKAYGFGFGQVRDLDPGLMYRAVAQEEVDVICAFATDGRIPAYELQPLADDRGFFPPYYAAPVVRTGALAAHPELRAALAPLAGALSDSTMQRLNYEVDEKQREPRHVAREFLEARGFIRAGTE
jgi:glycine betaine/choline ABC-type transport system substrate-binding protein